MRNKGHVNIVCVLAHDPKYILKKKYNIETKRNE